MESVRFLNPNIYSDPDIAGKIKQKIEEEKLLIQQEELRVESLPCPCCKAIEKEHFTDYEHNGILGSGSRAWVRQEYIICLSCGVHYSDLNKKKL